MDSTTIRRYFRLCFRRFYTAPQDISKTAQCSHYYSIDAAWIIFIRVHVTQAQGNKHMGGVATALIPYPNSNLRLQMMIPLVFGHVTNLQNMYH
jgi:hypothetical protein